MTNYYEGKIFRADDGKLYTNSLDGSGFDAVQSVAYLQYVVRLEYNSRDNVLFEPEVIYSNLPLPVVWTIESEGHLVGTIPTDENFYFDMSKVEGIATDESSDNVDVLQCKVETPQSVGVWGFNNTPGVGDPVTPNGCIIVRIHCWLL